MSALYALATDVQDSSTHNLAYGLVTDGEKTELVFAESSDAEELNGDEIRSLRAAFNARIGVLEDPDDLEEFAIEMFYNFPVQVDLSDRFETYEEAAEEVRMVFASHDDLPPEEVQFYTPAAEENDGGEEE